ncbi:hypothetical protein BDN72DRAFT_764570 [Pluteus cervinus]|uniref:Uncharacterized protein n=1 Tax=Pluteus cervinus TaxID=181527 RepID=A0ACD3B0Y7_9AGAR|nr:hypothetical protein BDN72DRAFT_764570 [Pluteus cervinus]
MSNPNSNPPGSQRAIASLAKKQSDVTRQGTARLKFVPTLPTRRKKEEEPASQSVPGPSSDNAQPSSSRGRGDPRGRGRGRPPPRTNAEMTASGPFAMGPALAGNAARRTVPRPSQAPVVPSASTSAAPQNGPSGARLEHDLKGKVDYDASKGITALDPEVYSDPEDGVEIIDLSNVRQLDWMAPESLQKDHSKGKRTKTEEPLGTRTLLDSRVYSIESGSEEESEAIFEDFSANGASPIASSLHKERLYFFQFPDPFPEVLPPTANPPDVAVPVDTPKKVAFGTDTMASAQPEADDQNERSIVDGVIGQLEVYRSGAVKMRLSNGILLDVHPATQPSFLQQAVHFDANTKQVKVLGEVNKRFIASPNVDALLLALDQFSSTASIPGEENLIKMDVS